MKRNNWQIWLALMFAVLPTAGAGWCQAPTLAEPDTYTIDTYVPDGVLRGPTSVRVDTAGNLYVVDAGNFVVRRFDTSGVGQVAAGTPGSNVKLPATTVANADRVKGICYTQTGDHCQSTQAVFSSPRDIVLDAKGNIYITDISAGKIRRIDVKTGIVTTFAGGAGGGWEDGQLHAPSGLAIGPNGILYVADKVNNVVRQVIPPTKDAKKASLVTIAGLGPNSPGCAQEGVVAATAPLTRPQDVAVDAAGNIYIADTGCRKIRVISKAGTISTLVGTGADHVGVPLEVPFTGSKGIGTAVNLAYPVGIAVDGVGNLVISDPGFDVLWLYRAKSQTVKVLAGLIPGQNTLAVCASARNVQGDGCVGTAAFLNIPGKPALDSSGNIYIPEQGGTKTPTHPFDVRILRPAAK